MSKRDLIAGLIVGVGISGGALVASGLPNPGVGECAPANIVVSRGEPTLIDTNGPVTGIRMWQVCGYQVPTGDGAGMRAVDDEFVTEFDLDDAAVLVEAADELLATDGNVFLHD